MLREIFINTDFNPDMAYSFIKQLEALEADSHDDIYVSVSSYGGCVYSCLSMIDACRRSPCNIHTLGLGKMMSAGAFFLIGAATDNRSYIFPNAQLMLHEARGFFMSDAEGIQHLKLSTEILIDTLAETTGKSVNEIEKLICHDFFMMAEQAVEEGWVGGYIGKDRGLL